MVADVLTDPKLTSQLHRSSEPLGEVQENGGKDDVVGGEDEKPKSRQRKREQGVHSRKKAGDRANTQNPGRKRNSEEEAGTKLARHASRRSPIYQSSAGNIIHIDEKQADTEGGAAVVPSVNVVINPL